MLSKTEDTLDAPITFHQILNLYHTPSGSPPQGGPSWQQNSLYLVVKRLSLMG